MRINWFKDENHLVYINGATQLAELERTLHFPGLEEAANELRQHPTAEGFTIKGPKRTSGRPVSYTHLDVYKRQERCGH